MFSAKPQPYLVTNTAVFSVKPQPYLVTNTARFTVKPQPYLATNTALFSVKHQPYLVTTPLGVTGVSSSLLSGRTGSALVWYSEGRTIEASSVQ